MTETIADRLNAIGKLMHPGETLTIPLKVVLRKSLEEPYVDEIPLTDEEVQQIADLIAEQEFALERFNSNKFTLRKEG